jgi:hypothetical protein
MLVLLYKMLRDTLMACLIVLNRTIKDKEPTIIAKR